MSQKFLNLFAVPWLALAVCLLLSTLPGTWGEGSASRLFLSSIVLFGLPHGACDLAYPGWCLRRPLARLSIVKLTLFYVLAMALVGVGWLQYPSASVLAFLLVTAWHWGSADASVLFPMGKCWALFSVGRGVFIMSAPFALQWEGTLRFLGPWLTESTASASAGSFVALGVMSGAVAAQFLAAQLGTTARGKRRRDGLWLKVIVEILGLTFLFSWLPPLVSIGIYFIFFHAWRHIQRLCDLRGQTGAFRRLLDFHRQALPLTIIALAGSFLVYFYWKNLPLDPVRDARAYFVALSLLTLPHAMIVLWSDLRAPATPC